MKESNTVEQHALTCYKNASPGFYINTYTKRPEVAIIHNLQLGTIALEIIAENGLLDKLKQKMNSVFSARETKAYRDVLQQSRI